MSLEQYKQYRTLPSYGIIHGMGNGAKLQQKHNVIMHCTDVKSTVFFAGVCCLFRVHVYSVIVNNPKT